MLKKQDWLLQDIPQNNSQETTKTHRKNENSEHACICDIFSQGVIDEVPEAYQEYKKTIIPLKRSWNDEIIIYKNYTKIKACRQGFSGGGDRSVIKGFSSNSRRRMIQLMASLEDYPNFWLDFTYPDEVVKDLTKDERGLKSARDMKELQRFLDRKYKTMLYVWKKEYVKRKSGALIGQYVPHFHVLLKHESVNQNNYNIHCIRIQLEWLRIIGANKIEKACKVATNAKSYRWLKNKKMAQIYVSKYVAKTERNIGFKTGRIWGHSSDLKIIEGIKIKLTDWEAMKVRRTLRGFLGKNKRKKILFNLLQQNTKSAWLLIKDETVKRILNLIANEYSQERYLSFPAIQT